MNYDEYKQFIDKFGSVKDEVQRSIFEVGVSHLSDLYRQARHFPHDNIQDNVTALLTLFIGSIGFIWVYKHIFKYFLKRLF